jgi:HK97 gp10 family phage protein
VPGVPRPVKITITLEGDKELARKLNELGLSAKKVRDAAVEAAAEVIQEAAQERAPGPGIGRERVEEGVWDVGPERAKWHYRFFETGTKAHMVTGSTMRWFEGSAAQFSRGHMVKGVAARPFLRPARDEREGEATAAFGKVIKTAVEKI